MIDSTVAVKAIEKGNYEWQDALAAVFQVWRERKIQADISSLWIDYAGNNSRSISIRSGGNRFPRQSDMKPVKAFVAEFVKLNDLPAIENFMTKLRQKLIGDEKQQRKFAKLLSHQKNFAISYKKLAPVGDYIYVAQTLNTRKTFWLGVKERQRFRFPSPFQVVTFNDISVQIKQFKSTEADAFIEWLGQSNVLANLHDFDPIYKTDNKGVQTSVWGETLKYFSGNFNNALYSDLLAEVAKQLANKADPTFGEKLFSSVAQGKPVSVYELLGSDLKTFVALPVEQQTQLAKFAIELEKKNDNPFGNEVGEPIVERSSRGKTCLFDIGQCGTSGQSCKTAQGQTLERPRHYEPTLRRLGSRLSQIDP